MNMQTLRRVPFDLQAGMRTLRDVENARNACWTKAEALHLSGQPTDALDDEAAACDESAERLRGIIVAAIEQRTGLSVDQLREALA